MKHDPILGLELVLTHYQGRLKDHLDNDLRNLYENLYFDNYHELYTLDREKARPYMQWWIRYEKL